MSDDAINKKHVVILGAAGFVGRACVRAFTKLNSEYEISCVVRKEIPELGSVKQIIGDIRNFDSRRLPNTPHVIVHLAVKQIDSDGSGYWDINVNGTDAILNNLNEYTLGVIYNSSMSVYGQDEQNNITEECVCNPTTLLSQSRYAAENLILAQSEKKNISAYLMRPRFVIGCGDQFVLPKLKSLAEKRISLNNGKPRYSVIHIDDYAQVITSLTTNMHEKENNKILRTALNIGYAEPLPLRDILFGLAKLEPKFSIPISASVLRILHRIPIPSLEQLATRLDLIGLSHFGNTQKLQQLLKLPLLQRSPLDALAQAISEM